MLRVPLEDVLGAVTELTRMTPRGKGYGVKGSAHTVYWPAYESFDLGTLIGMVYGDGNLIKRDEAIRSGKWRIEFCEGDAYLVKAYAELMHRLFNVLPTIRNRGGWKEAYVCSRIVYEFLTLACEHPNGKKAAKLDIPEIAKRSPTTMRGFLCGLFSVEGSVKGDQYVRLAMEMLEPKLIPSVQSELRSRGYDPHGYKYSKRGQTMFGVYLYGPENCAKFLREVGLLGKRKRKLSRFLKSNGWAVPARK